MRKYNPELLYFSFDSFSRIQCKNVVFCSLVKMFNLLNIFHFIIKNYKSLTKLKKSTSTSISPSLLSTTMHPYPLNHATHSPSKKKVSNRPRVTAVLHTAHIRARRRTSPRLMPPSLVRSLGSAYGQFTLMKDL